MKAGKKEEDLHSDKHRLIHNPTHMSPTEIHLSFALLLYKTSGLLVTELFSCSVMKNSKCIYISSYFTGTHVVYVMSQSAMYQLSLHNSSLLPHCCLLEGRSLFQEAA